jgi:hypothetical protein
MNIFTKLFSKKSLKQPEDDYKVTITTEWICVEHPKHGTRTVFWQEISEIRMINTDVVPFAPDIWLALFSTDTQPCLIPHGSKGCEDVYNIVSKYEGFDFENVIKSMSSVSNEQFLLWRKDHINQT